MKIFLKRPDITSDNKEDEEQSRQSAQPLKTTTDTKSLLSKKTKSSIAKASPSTAKNSVKTRSKTKSDNKSSTAEVSSSSKSASSDTILSPYAATSVETFTGGAASLAANVSSTITTMLNAIHADASSSTPFTPQQQTSRARGKIREGERAADEILKDSSMNAIQERTLEVIAAYEEIGNAFKRAAIAVEKLKSILPPGTSIVIPQLPVAPEISETQLPAAEFTNNTSIDKPSANAASSSASNNASIQNILNDTTSDSMNNDNDIWEYSDVNSPIWASHGDSSAWASKEGPSPFVRDSVEKDTSSPSIFSIRDSECIDEPVDDINKNACDGDIETLNVKRSSDNNVQIINGAHFGANSGSLHSRNHKEAYGDKVEREAPIVAGEPAAKIIEDARAESNHRHNHHNNGGNSSGDVNNRESKKKGHRSRNPVRHRAAPYTTTSLDNGKFQPKTFDYSNTNFTDEEIFILEEFNKYYTRRMLTDKSTKQAKVATEISSLTPKVTFEQTAVSKLIRRVKVPKDPATIKALEKWISNERAKERTIEQED